MTILLYIMLGSIVGISTYNIQKELKSLVNQLGTNTNNINKNLKMILNELTKK
jgi:hypothetical protein